MKRHNVAKETTNVGSSNSTNSEAGAVLILALAYIMIIGIVVGALTTWASGDLNSTSKFTSARGTDYSLSSAMEIAVNDIRYTPVVGSVNASPPVACWGSGTYATGSTSNWSVYSAYQLPTSTNDVSTWCSTRSNAGSAQTRIVTVYACSGAPAETAIAAQWNTASIIKSEAQQCMESPGLQEVVTFDDYKTGGVYSPGEGATLDNYEWSSTAQSTELANSINVTSTPPTPALVGGTYATTATATSGDSISLLTNNTEVCYPNGAVVTFVSDGTCIVTFEDAGNVNYLPATYTQTMTVGQLSNGISITSTAPSPAYVGSSYLASATAISGDAVSIAVDPSSSTVCTISAGTVYFTSTGNCLLNFTDPGNTDYAAATELTQNITVTVGTPAGENILAYTSAANGYPNNGDELIYTYNEPMNPGSLLSGFTGSSTSVYVELSRSNGSSTIWTVCATSNCSTAVNLGTVNLNDPGGRTGYYVSSGSTAFFQATMILSNVNGQSVVTVTLGTLKSGTVSALSPTSTQTTLSWTPSSSATGSLNNTRCSTTSVSEANAPIDNF